MIKLIQEFNQLDNLQQIYFLSLIEESFLLLEGIKSAREKYLNEIGEDKFNELIEIDPSKNKKYLDWICKEYLNGVDIERLRSDIKLFDEKCNKNLIDNKDIYFYDNINELENVLNQSSDISNTAKRKEIKKNPNKEEIEILPDIDVLRNDDEYFIAEIHSWEDAKFYGKGTKWCISERDSDFHWKYYYKEEKSKFIYVRDFKYPDLGINSDVNYKLMIEIPYGIIYNTKNNKINFSTLDYFLQDCFIWNALDESDLSSILEVCNKFELKLKDINNTKVINLNTKKGISDWLDFMKIKNYKINKDLIVDVSGNVNLSNKKLTEIPVQFGKVEGTFDCSENSLNSLKGSPTEVINFYCNYNDLESLEGSPKFTAKDFYCFDCNLKSLKGAPKLVGGDFNCANNKLKSLEGSPGIVNGNFMCYDNNLESLEGAPKIVEKNFNCKNNPELSIRYLDNFDFSFVNGDVHYK